MTARAALTFQVEGRLVGAWAKELEQSWKSTASVRGNRKSVIDLTGILFIDEEGKRVLTKLFREGARFRSAGPMTESIVSEITGKANRGLRPVLRRAVLPAILLMAVATFAKGTQPDAPAGPLRLTLRDAVTIALKQNPQVQVANLNVAVTQENQTIARSALLAAGESRRLGSSAAREPGSLPGHESSRDSHNIPGHSGCSRGGPTVPYRCWI
jgi:hypothetical protein